MGFLKTAFKGAIIGKVANEARKPKNQAKAKSAFSSLRSRISGQGSATPTGRGSAKASRGTTTKGTVTKRGAGKGTARPR